MQSRSVARVAAFWMVLSGSAIALAAEANPNCPPGGWFCSDDAPPGTPAPPPSLPPPTPSPPPPAASGHAPPATTVIVPGPQPGAPPPVVIYQQAPPPPPPVYVIRRAPAPAAQPPPPPPPPRAQHRRWGLNLRLQGVIMDDRQSSTAGMGGLGLSFRARPVPHFALDFGLDAVAGRDYNGNRRTEVPFTISALVYANPRDMAQFYMLAGIGWSSASVHRDDLGPSMAYADHYSYFGGQLGAGLEFRVSRPVSINVDLVGFVRGRTDSAARVEPEFVDPVTQRTTNTSGGGLFRAGVTFYW